VTIAQRIVVDVTLTTIGARVENEDGSPALGLRADDFEILEDGQPRAIGHFSMEEQPVATGLLVDRSISVGPVGREEVGTLVQITKNLNGGDQAFLMTFARGTNLDVVMTRDRNRILAALRRLKPAAGTRFYDASIDALDELSRSRMDRKALIILTDGADHYSTHTFQQLLRTAALYRDPVYIIGYAGEDSSTWTEAGRFQIRSEFSQLAERTGGHAFFPSGPKESMRVAEQIVDSLHHEYSLAFYSSGQLGESSDVAVRVRHGHRRVTVFPAHPGLLLPK
jgi:VWFA-related protein